MVDISARGQIRPALIRQKLNENEPIASGHLAVSDDATISRGASSSRRPASLVQVIETNRFLPCAAVSLAGSLVSSKTETNL